MNPLAFMFPQARRSEPRVSVPMGTFGSVVLPPKLAVSELAAEVSWEGEDSDVFRLTLPPEAPTGDAYPDIESALLAATHRRRPSQPELPPMAEPHRRTKS